MQFQTVAADVGFVEGPVCLHSREAIVFTSIDRGLVYEVTDGQTRLLARTGGGPNGATEGASGDIFVAQNGGASPAQRWPGVTGGVQAIGAGGLVRAVTTDPIHPNDLCFGPDGCLYVTDPSRGPARDDGRLWRVDPESGDAELLASVGWYPNGIGFGMESDAVYVAQSGERRILRIPLEGGRLGRAEPFTTLDHGRPDGFAWDVEGNLVVGAITGTAPGDLQVYDAGGVLIEVIKPGNGLKYTNVAIDGDGMLVVTDSDVGQVLVGRWPHAGLALHPFRNV